MSAAISLDIKPNKRPRKKAGMLQRYAFIANLSTADEELSEVDPKKEAKAEQAAADFLAELGLDDLEGPSSSAAQKEKQPAAAGKKKKRGGKKKGRKQR